MAILAVALFVAACGNGLRRRSFENEISLLIPAEVLARQLVTPLDYLLVQVERKGDPILLVYVGTQPETPHSPWVETIEYNGLKGKSYALTVGQRHSREVLLELPRPAGPRSIHFSYIGISPENAALADRIIRSVQGL